VVHQPVPQVTLDDLDRIVRRDFPSEQHGQVVNVLSRYGRGDAGHNRVCAAALKLADGDIERLEHYIDWARNSDHRDIMAWAEYPGYMDRPLGFEDAAEKRAIVEADWRQFQEWFSR
jgi:hypothetical protein